MVSSTDFLRASERTTAIATLNRRHHAEGSPLPRREQWARQGRSLESLTPRPGIREHYRHKADVLDPSSECLLSAGEFNWSAQHFLTLLILGIRRCAMVTSRIRFTAAQKAELWERWKNGQNPAAISRALERKNKTGVERIVVVHGGIVPAPRQRALA